MKLYFAPGACSMAPHLLLEELGIAYEGIPVDLKAHSYAGGDYHRVNPKGAVPAMEFDHGEVLTENAVILQFLADQKPEVGLLPRMGSWERYRALEWLNFIATELHKGFAPLFRPDVPADYVPIVKSTIAEKLAYVSNRLGSQQFLTGEAFRAPDAYLFVILSWADNMQIDLSQWPNLRAFSDRVKERAATQRMLTAEGLPRAA